MANVLLEEETFAGRKFHGSVEPQSFPFLNKLLQVKDFSNFYAEINFHEKGDSFVI